MAKTKKRYRLLITLEASMYIQVALSGPPEVEGEASQEILDAIFKPGLEFEMLDTEVTTVEEIKPSHKR